MDKQFETWNIEPGTLGDVDELEKLYDDICDYIQLKNEHPWWFKGVYPERKTAETAINDKSLFNIKIDNNIAGSIILNHKQDESYDQVIWGLEADDAQVIVIHTLIVNPNFLKQGIAQKLIAFAKDYAIEKSAKSIRLDVAIQNTPAISLYEKCGYKFVGTVEMNFGNEHLKWFKLYELVL